MDLGSPFLIVPRYQYREYLHNTLEDTIIRRQQYLELASSLPPDTVPSPLAHLSVSLTPLGGPRPGGRLSPQLGADVPRSAGPPPPWRGMVEHRTKRRYFRELMALRAEAGISSELSGDENYPGEFLAVTATLMLTEANIDAVALNCKQFD